MSHRTIPINSDIGNLSSTFRALDERTSCFKNNSPIILVFADCEYANVLKNWIAYFKQHVINNLLVIALDKVTENALEQQGINTVWLPWDRSTDSLWLTRTKLIKYLLHGGFDVVHSDADAVWLKNPVPFLNQINCDMAFSQGTSWPVDVFMTSGVVLCCGFYLIRANRRSLDFITQWLRAMEHDPDDQRVLNRLLLEGGLRWTEAEDYRLPCSLGKFKCYLDVQVTSINSGLTVGLLPHRDFQRVIEPETPFVAHLLSEKEGQNSEDVLRLNGYWIV